MDEKALQKIAENQNKIIKKMQEILERVGVLEDVARKIEKLEKIVSGHGTLLVDLRGQEAVDLHTSFPVKHEKDDENTSQNRERTTGFQKSGGILGLPEEERGQGDSGRPAPAPGQAN